MAPGPAAQHKTMTECRTSCAKLRCGLHNPGRPSNRGGKYLGRSTHRREEAWCAFMDCAGYEMNLSCPQCGPCTTIDSQIGRYCQCPSLRTTPMWEPGMDHEFAATIFRMVMMFPAGPGAAQIIDAATVRRAPSQGARTTSMPTHPYERTPNWWPWAEEGIDSTTFFANGPKSLVDCARKACMISRSVIAKRQALDISPSTQRGKFRLHSSETAS